MIPRPLHNIPFARQKKLRQMAIKRRWTWRKFGKKYPQPKWCQYPDAVTSGMMGCWSLLYGARDDLFKRKCDTCDLSTHFNQERFDEECKKTGDE